MLFAASCDETTPLAADCHKSKSETKPRPWYEKMLRGSCPGHWAVGLLVVCLATAMVAQILHKMYEAATGIAQHQTAPVPTMRSGFIRPVSKDAPHPVAKAANILEDFPKCNPATVFSGDQLAFVTALDDTWCSQEQAAVIRQLLEKLRYDFQAIVPLPYVYPARVFQNLQNLKGHQLETALKHYEKLAKDLGNLGSMVKLFAWGIPVHARELLGVFGGEAVVEALLRCNVITKCGNDSPIFTSTVQLFPVQHTSVIVVTDWPIPDMKTGLSDTPVEIVNLHTHFLAHNTPIATGTRILDVGTDSGVMGLVAASSGATEAVFLEPNPRAARFLRFSAQLSGLSSIVKVVEKPSSDVASLFQNDENKFFLMLAHAIGTQDQKDITIRNLLQSSKQLLHAQGSFVLGVEGYHCEEFQEDFGAEMCGDMNVGDLVGTAVCRKPACNKPPCDPSQEGIIYGWMGERKEDLTPQRDPKTCGDFNIVNVRSFETENGPAACSFARVGLSCPAPEAKVSLLRNLMGWGH